MAINNIYSKPLLLNLNKRFFLAVDSPSAWLGLNDFTERCIQLHGPARSVDLYALAQQHAAWHRACNGEESHG